LAEYLSKAEPERGISGFEGVELDRGDVEWLLVNLDGGKGPLEHYWVDERWGKKGFGIQLTGASFRECDLSGLPLAQANLRNATLLKVNLNRADLAGADLRGALLGRTSMKRGYLVEADLRGAHMGEVDLRCADLRNADLRDIEIVDIDLENADLQGANLEGVLFYGYETVGDQLLGPNLRGANFGGATLARASLNNAQLQRAKFFGSNLQGAELNGANLRQADLRDAQLEAADLGGSELSGADLRRSQLDYRTSLDGARLFSNDETPSHPATRLADVRWNGASVTNVADWSACFRLGDEDAELDEATRANRQVATLLRTQGYSVEADRFEYRARQLDRRRPPSLPKWMPARRLMESLLHPFTRLTSLVLDLISGYGYRPWRIAFTYILTVGGFAFIYNHWAATHRGVPAQGWDAVWFSVIAFHGRGVINSALGPGSPMFGVAALEAVLGLLVEVVFVATLIRRLFHD
jgi:uncharacterized protein YjbI with pentapeptide repeats